MTRHQVEMSQQPAIPSREDTMVPLMLVPVDKSAGTRWAGWEHDQALIDVYSRRIAEHFHDALARSAVILEAWWSGSLTLTVPGLIDTIEELIRESLASVLRNLWQESWYLGSRSAAIAISHEKPHFGGWRPGHTSAVAQIADEAGLRHLLDAAGRTIVSSIARTRMDELAAQLKSAMLAASGPADLITRLEDILNVAVRAPMIARTEISRAVSAAAMDEYRRAGISRKEWAAAGDACPICRENEAQGAISFSDNFIGGVAGPPQHPFCRCVTIPAHSVTKRRDVPPDSRSWGGGSGMGARSSPHEQYYYDPGNPAYNPEDEPEYNPGKPSGKPSYDPDAVYLPGPASKARPAGRSHRNITSHGPGSSPFSHGVEPPRWVNLLDADEDTEAEDIDEPKRVKGRIPRHISDQRPGTSAPFDSAGGEPPRGDMGTSGLVAGEVDDADDEFDHPDDPVQVDINGQLTRPRRRISDAGAYPYSRRGLPGGAPEGPSTGTDQAQGNPFGAPVRQGFPPDGDDSRHFPPSARGRPPNGTGKARKRKKVSRASDDINSIDLEARGITHAGLAVRAADTGRILMLQRALPDYAEAVKALIRKDAHDLSDPNETEAEHIANQLRQNYPEKAIRWVYDARWIGPVLIPHDRIDYDDVKSWAASHQPGAVKRFAKDIKAGTGHTHPVIMVEVHGPDDTVKVCDGHHRTLAYRKLGRPVKAYVGFVPKGDTRWEKTHSYQFHQGADPANKAAEKDPAEGLWEIPGGHLESDESAIQAASREWTEETGMTVPQGTVTGRWRSSNGIYAGFVYTIPSESDLPIFDGRDQVSNPDGNRTEAVAWWDPGQLKDNPAVRTEILDSLDAIFSALGLD